MQTTLNPELQAFVADMAARQYPGFKAVVPMLIVLPTGIHPFNTNAGYYDHAANCVVAYQEIGGDIIRNGARSVHLPRLVQHELAHWYQYNALGYEPSSVNVHRHKTWGEACFVGTKNLWPTLGVTRTMFSPYTSVRIDGQPRRVHRAGALSDVELHHWPANIEKLIPKLKAA